MMHKNMDIRIELADGSVCSMLIDDKGVTLSTPNNIELQSDGDITFTEKGHSN